jgi:hypothetical protein
MSAIDNSKTEIIRGFSLLWSLLAIVVCFDGQEVHADFGGSAFTYQGRLSEQGIPANGFYDLRFSLYDAGGSLIGTVTQTTNHVVNGTFTATLDFGSVFDGNPRWLDIAVRTNGSSEFTSMVPRQLITTAPYASYSTYSGVSARAKKRGGLLVVVHQALVQVRTSR